jgi:hypothetical protein
LQQAHAALEHDLGAKREPGLGLAHAAAFSAAEYYAAARVHESPRYCSHHAPRGEPQAQRCVQARRDTRLWAHHAERDGYVVWAPPPMSRSPEEDPATARIKKLRRIVRASLRATYSIRRTLQTKRVGKEESSQQPCTLRLIWLVQLPVLKVKLTHWARHRRLEASGICYKNCFLGLLQMDTKTIRDAILRRPFQPFTLRMNDGRTYFVPHPERAAVGPRVVFVVDRSGAGVLLEPRLIASLEGDEVSPPTLPPATGGNGPGDVSP